jgi:hypothetical protein
MCPNRTAILPTKRLGCPLHIRSTEFLAAIFDGPSTGEQNFGYAEGRQAAELGRFDVDVAERHHLSYRDELTQTCRRFGKPVAKYLPRHDVQIDEAREFLR